MDNDEYKLFQRILKLVAVSNARTRATFQDKINRLREENKRLSKTQTVVSRNNFFR